jgi:hypothetical protein
LGSVGSHSRSSTAQPLSELESMMTVPSIDALYEGFTRSLPPCLQPLANSLPHALKLAPVPTARWSDVFSHEVTLGAPSMVAEAFPFAAPDLVQRATLAHLLAVIEAFGSDRVADRQVVGSPELRAVLAHLIRARDTAMASLTGSGEAEMRRADTRTRAAVAEERALLTGGKAVSFVEYERVSLAKQAVGFPASVTLARALGAGAADVERVQGLLEGASLGLQFEDDVMDWEDDLQNGGAWASSLATDVRRGRAKDASESARDRSAVHASGALRLMLEHSRRCYRSAASHARALGALRLEGWAKARERRLADLIPLEAKHAGYSVRVRKLSPWALEVFA